MTPRMQPVTLIPKQTSAHANDEPVWEYSYEDLTFDGVKPEDIKGIAASMETMYKTMAAIYESFVDELGVSEKEAANILPKGLYVRLIGGDPEQMELSL